MFKTRMTLLGAALGLGTLMALPALAQQIDPPAGAKSRPQVTVLEPGAPPLRALRLHLKVGNRQSLQMDIGMQMQITIPGQATPQLMEAPTVRANFTTTVAKVDADGNVDVGGDLSRLTIVGDKKVNPDVLAAAQAAVKGFKNAHVSSRLTNRGETLSSSVTLPPGTEPVLAKQVGDVGKSMEQLLTPLPEAPIGVGARWQVVSDVEEKGIKLHQTVDYTLKSLKGDVVTLAVRMSQSAAPQALALPNLPPGTSATLKSFETTGTGTTSQDLARLSSTSTMDANTKFAMEIVQGPGKTANIQQGIRMSITVKPVKP